MNRRRLLHALHIIIAVALAVLVIWTTKPWQIWSFNRGFLIALAGSLLLDIALVVVWAYRHSYVLFATGNRVSPRNLILLVTFSNAANNLTPAATGELARVWFLKRNHGVPPQAAGGAIVFERLFLLGLMALTALGAGLIAGGASFWLVALTVSGILAYVLASPAVLTPLSRRLMDRPPSGGRVRRALVRAVIASVGLWSSRGVAVGTALWSMAAFTAQSGVFWIAANNSGLTLTATQTWALLGGGTVAGVLSALPFGIGAAEITAAGIAGLLGLDATAVASAYVLYRLFLTFPMALVGSYAYAKLSTAEAAAEPS